MEVPVGIIGNKGRYGKLLERLFGNYNCEVIGADAKDGPDVDSRNREIVERAEVVVFSLPPREIVLGAITRLIPYSRPEQLWMDVTSIKVAPVSAMLASHAEVLGLHPMCAPTAKSLRGQTVIVCPARLNKWQPWIERFLHWTGAKLKVSSPDEHDQAMAIVQGLVHAMQLIMAATIRSLGQDISESLSLTSPPHRIALSLMGRILKQNAELYADIQMLNPYVEQVLKQAAVEFERFREMVVSHRREMFVEEFNLSREHFGEKVLSDSYRLLEEFSELLTDRLSEHQVILEVGEDKPGLLHSITGVFAEFDINLTHIHSFRAEEGHRFLVGLDRPKGDLAAQLALKRIEELELAKQ